MIMNFFDSLTEILFQEGQHPRVAADVYLPVRKGLSKLHYATDLQDLRFPRAERVFLDKPPHRYGFWFYHQYCLTFDWYEGQAHNVRFEDRR